MKTKYIFNLLALAMLMPAMLLTTACSNEDDVVNNTENIANKGYALPVTVNVTRQDAAAGTRTTYTDNGNKTGSLAFSAGDKLFVKGNDYSEGGAGFFAGTLTWKSGGTFSGTILTKKEYTGTIDALFKAPSTLATLLPANYVNYSYLSFTDEGTYEASVKPYYTKTFASSKATAVEQFSNEVGGYTSGTGFVLNPANAILNFTITGLAADTGVDVALSEKGVDFTISGGVTTDDSGTATFAIGVKDETDLNELTLKVGGKSITLVSSSKKVAAGKIYNINRAVFTMAADATSADKGKLICTDGHIHANGADNGCTKARVAMIAYVGSDTYDATYKNGLAIALADEGSVAINWSTAKSTCEGKTAITEAKWCLPSQDQWKQMFKANGGDDAKYKNLNTTITNAGGTELSQDYYWSSTEETSSANAYQVSLAGGNVTWSSNEKKNGCRVRACLAF